MQCLSSWGSGFLVLEHWSAAVVDLMLVWTQDKMTDGAKGSVNKQGDHGNNSSLESVWFPSCGINFVAVTETWSDGETMTESVEVGVMG